VVNEQFDVIIVGGGPAGLAAGLYAARMNLSAVLVERGPVGGQLLNTELIEDYPGFESILGTDLAVRMGDHARKFGLTLREFESVQEIDVDADGAKVVRLDAGQVLTAPALIMAAGGLPRYLEVPGEKEFWGRGVSYCAVWRCWCWMDCAIGPLPGPRVCCGSGSIRTTWCPSSRSPSTYCSTAHVAPPWFGSAAIMPLTMTRRRSRIL
jgi:hypothetical protein